MNITPINENVLIKPIKEEEKTSSGLILPATDKEKNTGIVIAAPEDSVVHEGQKVQYREFAGNIVKIEMEEYILMPEEDLLCVFEEDETNTGKN